MTFEVYRGSPEMFYGTLAVVSADNLASLLMGGFKESCTATRCCRHCLAVQETARTLVGYSNYSTLAVHMYLQCNTCNLQVFIQDF